MVIGRRLLASLPIYLNKGIFKKLDAALEHARDTPNVLLPPKLLLSFVPSSSIKILSILSWSKLFAPSRELDILCIYYFYCFF